MEIRKTPDQALHGYKYCIQDSLGNIWAILPTKESRDREFASLGCDSDSLVEILFVGY
jgi:hypothetical protein